MTILRYRWEIFFAIIIAFAIPLAAYNYSIKHQQKIVIPVPTFITQASNTAQINKIPKIIPQSKTSSWEASDGQQQITMRENGINTPIHTYQFFVSPPNVNISSNTKPFFTATTSAKTTFSIPFNAFSPNDQYLFLQEKSPNETKYLLFNSSGQPFTNGNLYEDIGVLFKNYTSSYILSDVTGWASDTLLVIETQDGNGNPSKSFWFDVTNFSFIPLATRF